MTIAYCCRVIRRGYRFKICPTAEQEAQLRQFVGVCRLVYNLALEQRRDWWRHYQARTGHRLRYTEQARELTTLRAEFDWIAAVSQTAQQQALRDLDMAFERFFSGHARYPTPRKKGLNDSFRVRAREVRTRPLNAKWMQIWIPKIGWVATRKTREIEGVPLSVTISSSASGWSACFNSEITREPIASSLPAVGIDRGVVKTLVLSTGEERSLPVSLNSLDRAQRRAQRCLARQVRGSKRYAAQRRRIARMHARAVRIREDFHHKAALYVARQFGLAVLEDLNVVHMTASASGTVENPGRNVRQKAGLNRAIRTQGWRNFERILTYKMEERGGRVVKVDPAYTSQTCASCGVVDRRSRKSQAIFECVECGHRDNADVNAAINILRRSTASMRVEGGHFSPREARTGGEFRLSENPGASALGGMLMALPP